MEILNNLKKEKMFYYFTELCKIPHGSGNTQKISEYCINFAKEHSLEYYSDSAFNVIIKKPASKNYENHPAIILQGHLDMVCEKTPESNINFLSDPIKVLTDGKFLFADGTTLGGDDGIAVAMILSILSDNTLEHPPIEAVFTTDEETGMYGAIALETNILKARRLINIDSEEQGVLTAGCAGGTTGKATFCLNACNIGAPCYKISVGGLLGGHSGIDIDKNRLNANKVMGTILNSITEEYNLIEIFGGDKDNAIARNCVAVISCGFDIANYIEQIKTKFKNNTQTPKITVEPINKVNTAICSVDSKKIAKILFDGPNGVVKYSKDIQGLVQTSVNMGVIKLIDNVFSVTFSLRSSLKSELEDLKCKINELVKSNMGNIEFGGSYPAWEYKENSPLRETLCNIYKKMYGAKMKVDVIHAGLECGLFSQKIDGLDAVSIGPNLYDVHTPNERLDILSAKSTYEYLCEVLKNL